jgi:Tfp pilus assembly protein PilF
VEPLIDSSSLPERMMLAQSWAVLSRRSNLHEHASALTLHLELAARMLESAPRTTGQEWLAVGMLYEMASQLPAAERSYRRALELTPDLPIAQNNLAMLLLSGSGDAGEALTLATRAASHSQHPLRGSFLDTLATVQAKLRQYDAAESTLKDAIRLDPRNVQWQLNLVRVLADAGQRDKAKAALVQIDNSTPDLMQLPEPTRQQIQQLRAELE